MAQRDYEDQPEAPDLGASVQAEAANTLSGPAGADPLDAGYIPPDRPYGLDDDATTPAGQLAGDSLDQRLHREQPEELPVDPDRSGRIEIAGEGAAQETPDAMDAHDVGIDGGSASAEEAAVHTVDLGADDAETDTAEDERVPDDPAVAESLARVSDDLAVSGSGRAAASCVLPDDRRCRCLIVLAAGCMT